MCHESTTKGSTIRSVYTLLLSDNNSDTREPSKYVASSNMRPLYIYLRNTFIYRRGLVHGQRQFSLGVQANPLVHSPNIGIEGTHVSAARITAGLPSVGICVQAEYTTDITNNERSNHDTTHPKIQRQVLS